MEKANKAVFLDRDGTIIYDRGYLSDPQQVKLISGVGDALLKLKQHGFLLIVVSNQSGVGRGLITRKDVGQVHRRVENILLEEYGVQLDGSYYCFHAPWENCSCRKPRPELILRAAEELDIILSSSFIIGDKISDIEAGIRAGCKSILLAFNDRDNSKDATIDFDYIVVSTWEEALNHIIDSGS